MRRITRRLLQILDGTPAEYAPEEGEKQKGQSLVEMAFITPLILLLIVGIVEIGWFANNYLVLLEVTRVGARRGAVVSDSPLDWDDRGSLVWTQNQEDIDPYFNRYDVPQDIIFRLRQHTRNFDPPGDAADILDEPGETFCTSADYLERNSTDPVLPSDSGFYFQIVCQMLNSLEPLELDYPLDAGDEEDRTDDIVISVFQIAMIDNRPVANGGDYNFEDDPATAGIYDVGPVPVVVGRYPSNANECNVVNTGGGFRVTQSLERDPFDWDRDNIIHEDTVDDPAGDDLPRAWSRELGGDIWAELNTGQDLNRFDNNRIPEMQRGWSYTGYHIIQESVSNQTLFNPDSPAAPTVTGAGELFCIGSEFTVDDIEELMAASGFELTPQEAGTDADLVNTYCEVERDPDGTCPTGEVTDFVRRFYPNHGLVLVEIFWEHELLLDLPGFSPVFNIIGGDSTVINVWSAFPVPSISPRIDFDPSYDQLADD